MFNKILEPTIMLEPMYRYNNLPLHVYNDMVYTKNTAEDRLCVYKGTELTDTIPLEYHTINFYKNYVQSDDTMYEVTEKEVYTKKLDFESVKIILLFSDFEVIPTKFGEIGLIVKDGKTVYTIPRTSDKEHLYTIRAVNNREELGILYQKRILLYDSNRNKLRHLMTSTTNCINFDYIPEQHKVAILDEHDDVCLWDDRYTKGPIEHVASNVIKLHGFVLGHVCFIDDSRNVKLGKSIVYKYLPRHRMRLFGNYICDCSYRDRYNLYKIHV